MERSPIQMVADAAEWLIENGAEIARVQTDTEALARAAGMREAECFALPTGVVITVEDAQGKTTTVVRRIHQRVLHLERLNRLEACIREAVETPTPLEIVVKNLRSAAQAPGWGPAALIPASGLAAGGFALFYGGNLAEGAFALGLGLLWALFKLFLERPWIPGVFTTAIGSFFAVEGSLLGADVFHQLHAEPIATGTLMLLVPGLALVQTLRDLVAGELVTAQSRFAEVLMTGAALAIGATVALSLHSGKISL